MYHGLRSPSSGAAANDSGDVVTPKDLIECKTTGAPGSPVRPPAILGHLVKIIEEAQERGRTGVLALRYYAPDHELANRDGWVEITIRRTSDDAARSVEALELEVDLLIAHNKVFDLEGSLRGD